MAKLFNQGLGKWPRIKFRMVSFIESLNTSPGQAPRYASQTCYSVPLLKVPTFKQQQSTGAHSETHAEPTLKSHSRFSRVLRNRSLLSFGRTGALCCSTSSTCAQRGAGSEQVSWPRQEAALQQQPLKLHWYYSKKGLPASCSLAVSQHGFTSNTREKWKSIDDKSPVVISSHFSCSSLGTTFTIESLKQAVTGTVYVSIERENT